MKLSLFALIVLLPLFSISQVAVGRHFMPGTHKSWAVVVMGDTGVYHTVKNCNTSPGDGTGLPPGGNMPLTKIGLGCGSPDTSYLFKALNSYEKSWTTYYLRSLIDTVEIFYVFEKHSYRGEILCEYYDYNKNKWTELDTTQYDTISTSSFIPASMRYTDKDDYSDIVYFRFKRLKDKKPKKPKNKNSIIARYSTYQEYTLQLDMPVDGHYTVTNITGITVQEGIFSNGKLLIQKDNLNSKSIVVVTIYPKDSLPFSEKILIIK